MPLLFDVLVAILLWKWCRVAGPRRNLFHFRNPRQSFAGGIRALIISTAIHAPVIAASTRNALNRYLSRTRPTTKGSTIPSVVFNYNERSSNRFALSACPSIPRLFHPLFKENSWNHVNPDKNRRETRRTFIILICSLQHAFNRETDISERCKTSLKSRKIPFYQ